MSQDRLDDRGAQADAPDRTSDGETPTERDSETLDAPAPSRTFAPGAEIGGRYRIISRVGAGGMGEVWRAYDLKLRVEVALKALRGDVAGSERHLEALRQEVRAARQVVSPNVCRIYDLEEVEDLELVSMEYVDGQTLLEVLRERGPLELAEAQDIASQFLAGLEAIHAAGFIHRDIKPENIMVTRAGRVVVMDFGLARHEADPSRSASGTPAYMAPEQVRGEVVDARADVYAAGVVLAEMVSPAGVKDLESRKSLWEGVRSEPPRLPDSPWKPVLRRAVAKEREQRYRSAHTLTRALEEVTLRVVGAEDLTPYPGLASFTEADAEFFFGREAEIEEMWRLLGGPPRLLAIMGPSGAGKTSFIRAGVNPNSPSDWSLIRCTPGSAAIASLRGALTSELRSGSDALRRLVTDPESPDAIVDAVSCWSGEHAGAVIIVDQFEELFTLNSVEEQRLYAALLGRLPLEANVHVVLSMRDDFAAFCNRHEALRPVFRELTVLDPPIGANLRRALVQPATTCGYRFEDDELIDEIMDEVEGERGALPLLAFALARLWEKRDRETGLLTRQAYHDIGGVGGAIARHADATVDRVGSERVPIVRDIFRNLVTAEGTRAVREWDELLSVFGGSKKHEPSHRASEGSSTRPSDGLAQDDRRAAAEDVLRELVDARLLTSYELKTDDDEPIRRVEIIHESLLANWPRLVRWRTQDQEGAQLRDELRQAARTWDEHGRSDDLLWTGTAYREFRLWRERYPGGLSDLEEAFANAMTAFASRRRRRRRLAAAAVLAVAVVVGAVTTALWRSSVAETRRAEAGKLLAIAQTELENEPTAALAYVRASLEQADTPEARRFAVEVLWRGPVARILPARRMAGRAGLPDDPSLLEQVELSPDGRWLATSWIATHGRSRGKRQVLLFPSDGGPPRALPRQTEGNTRMLAFAPGGDVLITGGSDNSMVFWSLPGLEEIRTVDLGGGFQGRMAGDRLLTYTWMDDEGWLARMWPLPDGEPEVLSVLPSRFDIDPGGTVAAHFDGRSVLVTSLGPSGDSKERVLGEAGDVVQDVRLSPGGDRLAALDRSGELRVWSTDGDATGPLHVFRGPRFPFSWTRFGPTGRLLTQMAPTNAILLWDLDSPPSTEPRSIRRSVSNLSYSCTFDPAGRWAVTDFEERMIEFWPLETPWARTFSTPSSTVWSMAFTADGRWLATCPALQPARLWPLDTAYGSPRDLLEHQQCSCVATHPARDDILVGADWGDVLLYPVSGGSLQRLLGGFEGVEVSSVSFDPEGRRVVAVSFPAGPGFTVPPQRAVRVWDLESGAERVYSIAHLTDADWDGPKNAGFAHDGGLYASLGRGGRLMRLTLPADPGGEISAETVVDAGSARLTLSQDGRFLLVHTSEAWNQDRSEELLLFDLVVGTSRRITTHGSSLFPVSQVDPTGRFLVTADYDGVVRAGPISGEEPHLLLGHEGVIHALAISPDSRWIASASDESVRLWLMPDMTKPPLHTLPHDELIAKLDSFTNLRAVRDATSASGWTIELGPFPGWETVPTW